ncbi:MAG TPA: tRNA pseudouridine(55) synthase TruB [Pyrinomonadaceae bacterium]|jgi:tRNA pseudouridine55 synthase
MDGVLIIDKPAGLTSHDVVARVRRILGERRVGHTGTLDPFATGVLVLLVGRATRLAQFLSGAEKEYQAVVRLGYATETGDATGRPRLAPGESESAAGAKPDIEAAAALSLEQIEAALAGLRGESEQMPPMYSAKKVAGKKLYELARRGEEIERRAVPVTIYELEAVEIEGELLKSREDGTREMGLRVVCSAGTYIRVLAEDLGRSLGTAAHLSLLRRTRAGQFKIEDAARLEELAERAGAGRLAGLILSPGAALSRLPALHLTGEDARRVRHGMALGAGAFPDHDWQDGEPVRLFDEQGQLMAVGVYEAASERLRPRVVLAAGEE